MGVDDSLDSHGQLLIELVSVPAGRPCCPHSSRNFITECLMNNLTGILMWGLKLVVFKHDSSFSVDLL